MHPKLEACLQLVRFDRPIGSLLILWPTLIALWLAAQGIPQWRLLLIFGLGVFLMRSAGCAINDFADRKVDGAVKRTKGRPLVTGLLSPAEAIAIFAGLSLIAFGLVLLTNALTIALSLGAVALAACYPFMKRYTHWPQLVLGAAFSWSIPMAFAAQTNSLPKDLWWLYAANLLWTLAYDTIYAMVDRDDDQKIGLKSTAVLFAGADRLIIAVIQCTTLALLLIVGTTFDLGTFYYCGLTIAACLFVYQQYLIKDRQRDACFKAFLNNNYVGLALFVGTALHYL